LRLDRTYGRGVGRIARGIGSTNPADLALAYQTLDRLFVDGNLELLRAVRDAAMPIPELLQLARTNTLAGGLAAARLRRNLTDEIARCLPLMGTKQRVRDGYEQQLTKLVRAAQRAGQLQPHAAVHDLYHVDWHATITMYLSMRVVGSERLGNNTWNNCRIALGSFLSQVCGKGTAPRAEIMSKVIKAPKVPPVAPNATLEQVFHVINLMPTRHARAAFVLLTTGLRVEEMRSIRPEHLKANSRVVRVKGMVRKEDASGLFPKALKNDGSEADVSIPEATWPVLVELVSDMPSYNRLRRAWCVACDKVGIGVVVWTERNPESKGKERSFTYLDGGMRLHGLRHKWALAVHKAGASKAAVQKGLRHQSSASTDIYLAQADNADTAELMHTSTSVFDTARLIRPAALDPVDDDLLDAGDDSHDDEGAETGEDPAFSLDVLADALRRADQRAA